MSGLRTLIISSIVILASFCSPPRAQVALGEESIARTPVAPVELRVLQQTADIICPASEPIPFNVPTFRVQPGLFVLDCVHAEGHATSVRIQRHVRAENARVAFNEDTGAMGVGDFHGRPSLEWEEALTSSSPEGNQRTFEWYLEKWIFKVIASDDTVQRLAPNPREVAEIMYQIVEEIGLSGN